MTLLVAFAMIFVFLFVCCAALGFIAIVDYVREQQKKGGKR